MTAQDKAAKAEKNPPQKHHIKEGTTVKDLADTIGIKTKDLVEGLRKKGLDISVNQEINQELADTISQLFNLEIQLITLEEEILRMALSDPNKLVPRPSVVTIMGHVDHGKTTLLDAIRESNLVNKESGGITQHIGAYKVEHKGRSITFIDTPGHEAFTRLRSRGAISTDIVILVVAAEDGVMPQTREAISHAKAADVPIIVAINKIDKAEADLDKTKKSLSKEGLVVEEWGGDVVSVDISATKKTNLDELLEMIVLLSDMLELKGNPHVPAQGIVLEARLDPKKGPIATVIIQHGILRQGEAFLSGTCFGKARALFDEKGKGLKQAEISSPVEILGFSEVPTAGEIFQVLPDLETAKKIAEYRSSQIKEDKPQRRESLTLDQLFKDMKEGGEKELPLVIKTDVQGSAEVLNDILPNLSTEQVKINIIHSATGNITEGDIMLASASKAIIIGYNIRPSQDILDLAKKEDIEVRNYKVIYQLTDDIKKAMKGLLDPIIQENFLGRAEIRRIYHIPKVGTVAGCLVTDGKITRNAEVKVMRNDEVIHKGRISSLKHLKNNVTEVKRDYECGIGIEKFPDIQEGDVIEAFITEKIKPE